MFCRAPVPGVNTHGRSDIGPMDPNPTMKRGMTKILWHFMVHSLPISHGAITVKHPLRDFLFKGVLGDLGFVDRDAQARSGIGVDRPCFRVNGEPFLHNILSPGNIIMNRFANDVAWLGKPNSSEAAVLTGPWGLCGARAIRWASAKAAMRRDSVKPPQWVISSWQISHPRTANRSRKAARWVSLSPVAMGVVTAALIAARLARFSGQQGSSKKYKPNLSRALANCIPMAGDGLA